MSDQICIEKYITQNDETAFTKLVARHRPFIRRVIFSVFAGWSEEAEEAEEAEQDVLIALSRNLQQYRGESSFRTYLYRLTRNRAIDRLRQMRRSSNRLTAFEDFPGGDDPLDLSIRNEDRRFLYSLLDSLKEEARSLILLKDIEGLSIEDIAELTGLPTGTVKSRLHRGRNRMIKTGERLMKGGGE